MEDQSAATRFMTQRSVALSAFDVHSKPMTVRLLLTTSMSGSTTCGAELTTTSGASPIDPSPFVPNFKISPACCSCQSP